MSTERALDVDEYGISMFYYYYVVHVLLKNGWFLKAKFSMFCLKKGGKMLGKIHGKGLKLSSTDKRGFHFYASAPHPCCLLFLPWTQVHEVTA